MLATILFYRQPSCFLLIFRIFTNKSEEKEGAYIVRASPYDKRGVGTNERSPSTPCSPKEKCVQ